MLRSQERTREVLNLANETLQQLGAKMEAAQVLAAIDSALIKKIGGARTRAHDAIPQVLKNKNHYQLFGITSAQSPGDQYTQMKAMREFLRERGVLDLYWNAKDYSPFHVPEEKLVDPTDRDIWCIEFPDPSENALKYIQRYSPGESGQGWALTLHLMHLSDKKPPFIGYDAAQRLQALNATTQS